MHEGKEGTTADILLVEDNQGEVRLVVETFKEGKIEHEMHVAHDGEEAINFLLKNGKYKDAPRPDVIILDINLPKKSGFEVLKVVRNTQGIQDVPVVILTASGSEQDVIRSKELDVNKYIVKPIDYDRFIVAIQAIESFMLTIIKQKKGE
jgi:two-component system, chemotaxis family, response regulator Rcp1